MSSKRAMLAAGAGTGGAVAPVDYIASLVGVVLATFLQNPC